MRSLRILMSVFLFFLPFQVLAQEVGTITFAFDSAELDAKARAEIITIAGRLQATSGLKPTVVVGHTDAVGGQSYNQQLGLRRARAVADALVAAGAPVNRIGTVESRGKNELLVRVSGPERRNRRVTVTLDEILAACRTWREVGITQSSVGAALDADLGARLEEAVMYFDAYANSGTNGPAFQMAGAAREDCGSAVGFRDGSLGKIEYAQRCICNSTRLRVAAGIN